MSNKEILDIYKTAEKHWSRPIWLCWILGWNYTDDGLCKYFRRKHFKYHLYSTFKDERLWLPYRTLKEYPYHFYNRKERLYAIRKVIKDLENGEAN